MRALYDHQLEARHRFRPDRNQDMPKYHHYCGRTSAVKISKLAFFGARKSPLADTVNGKIRRELGIGHSEIRAAVAPEV
jgi:hypothetical protein